MRLKDVIVAFAGMGRDVQHHEVTITDIEGRASQKFLDEGRETSKQYRDQLRRADQDRKALQKKAKLLTDARQQISLIEAQLQQTLQSLANLREGSGADETTYHYKQALLERERALRSKMSVLNRDILRYTAGDQEE